MITTVRERAREQTMVVPADLLGSADFRHRHGLRLAYVAGSMYRGISSPDMIVRMGRAGLLAFLGSGGLAPARPGPRQRGARVGPRRTGCPASRPVRSR